MTSLNPRAPHDGVPQTLTTPPAPTQATPRVSFFVDDLPDAPIGPGEAVGWYQIDDSGKFYLLDPFDWPKYFVISAPLTAPQLTSEPAPVCESPPHFLDDLPDSTPSSEQHLWLESHGFHTDDSMGVYTHSLTPCPVCASDGHALFARWGEDSAAPTYFCQKLRKRTEWSPAADAPPAPEVAGGLPVEDDADPPDESAAAWVEVASIEELKALPRWIAVRNKKPLTYHPNNDPGLPLKASTFSHKETADSKCGGFVDGITAKDFVRHGGTCLDHISVSRKWDAKEARFRRQKTVTPHFQSVGWRKYADWQSTLEGQDSTYGISYATGYADAPAVVILDLDYPKPPKGEELDPLKAEGADLARDTFTQTLESIGCPVADSASGKGRRLAFRVHTQDADYYESKHAIWRHESGIVVEVYPPGARRHVMLYGLDGALPQIDPVVVEHHLLAQGFTMDAPWGADSHRIKGGKGLQAFMEVCDREGWDLAFNEMSKTAFANGLEQDNNWIHRVRSHLELNYVLTSERTTPNGGTYELVSKFNVSEKLVYRWGLEAAVLRRSYHPVRDWLAQQPAWDETPRIDFLLEWCFAATVEGDDSGRLVRIASRDIIMGLVNRAMEPGCAWPRIVVLWGPQAAGKTSYLENVLPQMDLHYEAMHFPMTDEELFDSTSSPKSL